MSTRPSSDERGAGPAGDAASARADRLAVGVNLVWIVPGVVGGSEEYLVRSLLALAERQPAHVDVTVFGLDALADAHPELADAFRLVTVPLRGRLKAARVAAETSWLALEAHRRGLDVVHHGGGVLPVWAPAHTVVTIHDIQPLVFPDAFPPVKRRWLGWMLPRAARRADLVVTTSDFVKRSLIDRLGVPPGRIHLVPPCLSERAGAVRPAAVASVRDRYGIGPRYVVYPAITYAHKNHRVLVDALAGPGCPHDLELVLTGGSGPAEAALAARVAQLDLGARVHRPGRVPRADLDALLAGALAMAFPSTYEGFGMGVLEALAAGTPVVAARAAALPELVAPQRGGAGTGATAGGAAAGGAEAGGAGTGPGTGAGAAGLLVDADDAAGWAAAFAELAAEPPARRRARIAAGTARALTFSPSRTAAALLTAWHRAAGRPEEHP